jgi:hypothetical protein
MLLFLLFRLCVIYRATPMHNKRADCYDRIPLQSRPMICGEHSGVRTVSQYWPEGCAGISPCKVAVEIDPDNKIGKVEINACKNAAYGATEFLILMSTSTPRVQGGLSPGRGRTIGVMICAGKDRARVVAQNGTPCQASWSGAGRIESGMLCARNVSLAIVAPTQQLGADNAGMKLARSGRLSPIFKSALTTFWGSCEHPPVRAIYDGGMRKPALIPGGVG